MTIREPILDACYFAIRDIQTSNLFNKVDMFGLSGSGDGATVKKNPLMNEITCGTHNPVNVCGIFYCTRNMERGNTNNSKFMKNCMKGFMD